MRAGTDMTDDVEFESRPQAMHDRVSLHDQQGERVPDSRRGTSRSSGTAYRVKSTQNMRVTGLRRETRDNDLNPDVVAAVCHIVLLAARERLIGPLTLEPVRSSLGSDSVKIFKRLLHAGQIDECVEAVDRAGRCLEDRLGFLEAVAVALGDDWCDDQRSFIDVTIAIGRLQIILRRLVEAHRTRWVPVDAGMVIFAVPPGEAHQFGQTLLEEVFRARGWATRLITPSTTSELIAAIASNRADIVCLSWSTDRLSSVVAETLDAVDAMDPAIRPAVIAGGTATQRASGWMTRLGVDFVCDSAYRALETACHLIEIRDKSGIAYGPAKTVCKGHVG